MKIRIFIIAGMLFLNNSLLGQRATYINLGVAVNNDIFEFYDPCNIMQSAFLLSHAWSVTITQEVIPHLSIESGFISKVTMSGIKLNREHPDWGQINSFNLAFYSTQIPLRIKGNIFLIKNKLQISSTLGYHFGINHDYYWEDDYSETQFYPDDTISYTRTSFNPRKNYSLVEAGIGFNYAFNPSLEFAAETSYYKGFNRVYRDDIEISSIDCSTSDGFGFSEGSYWSLVLTLRLKISNLWNKENG